MSWGLGGLALEHQEGAGVNLESLNCLPSSSAYRAGLRSEIQGWRAHPSACSLEILFPTAGEEDDRVTSWQPQAVLVGASGLRQLPPAWQTARLLGQALKDAPPGASRARVASSQRSPVVAFHAAQQAVTLASGRLAACPSANKAGGFFKCDFCLVAAAGVEETGKLVRSEKERSPGEESSPASPVS